MSDALQHFSVLDELVQVIYQGLSKFVVLSRADDDRWTILLGRTGDPEDGGGRWWRGKWEEKDVFAVAGANVSDVVLEAFADRIADSIVQGEICVGNWEDGGENRDTAINFTIGPTAKRPLRVALEELSPGEAAAAAAQEFFNIALQAQSRKCRLNPPAFGLGIASPPPPVPSSTVLKKPSAPTPAPSTAASTTTSAAEKKQQDKIRELEARLAAASKGQPAASGSTSGVRAGTGAGSFNHKTMPFDQKPKPEVSAGAKPPKGASLANPNKKARKYQAMEFASDDEDEDGPAPPPAKKKSGATASGSNLAGASKPAKAAAAASPVKKGRKVQKVEFESDDD